MTDVKFLLPDTGHVRLEVTWVGEDADTMRRALRDDAKAEGIHSFLQNLFDNIPLGMRSHKPPPDSPVGSFIHAAEHIVDEHRRDLERAGARP